MHADDEGRKVLAAAMVSRFADVADYEYDDIRRMAAEANLVCLSRATE